MGCHRKSFKNSDPSKNTESILRWIRIPFRRCVEKGERNGAGLYSEFLRNHRNCSMSAEYMKPSVLP